MAPTFCNRCGDAEVEEGRDPRDELAEIDALLERLILKRYDLKGKINRFLQSHHPPTSSRRYVDHFRVLSTGFYGSSTFTFRETLYTLISWSHLQLLERHCMVNT